MATYKSNIDTVAESIIYTVDERHIYGSDRVGMYNYPDTVYPVPAASTADFQPVWRGYRKYELKNHLGNVTTVINANKIPLDANTDGTIDGFDAIIEGAYDYSPFGVTRKSFEPNYSAGTSGEANPLAPDFRWCFDGDGVEANGSGHDATLNNITTINDRDGDSGEALKSAGNTNSYMEIDDHADFDFGAADFTVGIWVKKVQNFTVISGSWQHTIAVGKWHSGQQSGFNEWYLAITNGGVTNNPPQFAIEIGTTKYTAVGSSGLPTGEWYHLVGVRDGTNIKLYVDGVLEDTKAVGSGAINNEAAREILIGRMDNGNYLEAGFDEFVVYHRALSDTEVNELYGQGCADFEGEVGELASGGYRYGFNGKEKDDEVSGKGNQYDYGFRIYNPRLGRFLSTDPLFQSYPWYTPYQFAGNKVIVAIDLDGLEEYMVYRQYDPNTGKVNSSVKFVPLSDREVINGVARGGVDYQVTNSQSGEVSVYQFPDFIQGTKEAKARSQKFTYYETKADFRAGTNSKVGPLGNSNGQTVAQGKYVSSIRQTLSGMLFSYEQPTLEEFYGTNKYGVTSQQLNARDIADYLVANPTFTATVEAHTDRVGSDSENVDLSQKRANGLVQEIVGAAKESGKYSQDQINDLKSRITPKGLGESRAKSRNAVDNVQNQKDRTTSIKISDK